MMKRKKILNLFLFTAYHLPLITISFFLTSCGYSTSSVLPSNLKTIHVETFQNNISYAAERGRNLYFPLLEQKVKTAIVNRFQYDGNLKLTESSNADLILKGKLESYERSALRFTDNNDVQEYRIHVVVSLELFDTQKGEARFVEPSFAGEATYFVTGPTAKSEEAAVEDAVVDLARRIVERTIEDW